MNSSTSSSETPEAPSSPRFRGYVFLLGLGLLLLGGGILGAAYVFRDRLAPPPFTGSVSFDEKALWLAPRLKERCDILAIGSSMTLNNLDSAPFQGKRFLNASSWGMKLEQTEYFLGHLLRWIQPKTIVTLSCPLDFEREHRGAKIYDADRLRAFLDTGNLTRAQLQYFSLNYHLENFRAIQRDRVGRRTYYSLDFDSGGAVPLAKDNFQRVEKRWLQPIATLSNIDEVNYAALDRVAALCRERGIHFLLVQTPIRQDVLRPEDKEFLAKHFARLAETARKNGQIFLDLHGQMPAPDSIYADSTHLNEVGARQVSELLLAKFPDHFPQP